MTLVYKELWDAWKQLKFRMPYNFTGMVHTVLRFGENSSLILQCDGFFIGWVTFYLLKKDTNLV